MDSSDDEAETLPQRVSNYHFVDQDDLPVPFSVFPLVWTDDGDDDGVPAGGVRNLVFLHGEADNGLQKIYKEVKAWRFDLTNTNPEISVLAKDGKWLKLHKPRKWFEDSIRSVLITIRGLHYLRRNPNVSEGAFWDYLARVFGSYDLRPSAKDLAIHLPVITEARARDGLLANAKLLNTFLEEKPWRRRASGEDLQSVTKPNFIVTDQEGVMDAVEAEFDDAEDDCFDSVCAFCDNGGNILCCDGKCMRSFHATLEDGEDSLCDSLELTQEQVDVIDTFYCKNCKCNQHQCFACGKLGSSDKSKSAEVFQCVSATCGYFYHPLCVAKLLHCQDGDAAESLHMRILSGEPFTCPLHKCCVCCQMENKEDHALQFAVCRRCPKAYHRKCLPREIAFEDSDKDMAARAWENLLPKRILIYCLKHKIIENLGTPVRDHIKFPGEEAKRTVVGEKRKGLLSTLCLSRGKEITKQSSLSYASPKTAEKEVARKKKLSLATELGDKRKKVIASSPLDALKKVKVVDPSKASRNSSVKSGLLQEGQASVTSGRPSLGERLYSYAQQCSEEVNLDKKVTSEGSLKRTKTKSVLKKLDRVDLSLDPESERRIIDVMKDATSSVSMKDVLQKHKIMSTHTHSHNSVVEKTITAGKLDAAVEAVRAALERLEAGGSIEDAQAVCGRDVLSQIFKWKDKLRVYLAPFLHGVHYTSFGRHFTKVEKLQEIVDKLHYYVQDGDTVSTFFDWLVDFCCGANDFSCLLAERLEENGKKCSYKNYDILPPKNDFHFERKDWMTVIPKDMPHGSKLIIGLNPPFGVRASLANKFVDKALEFRPKLIILIVPPETERLDLKKNPYDLVWEDNRFLSGKSFYLPGSVDENDKQVEQWNCSTPLLYLWSRQDWSAKHKAIAKTRGHLSLEGSLIEESYNSLHYPHLTGSRSLSGDNAMDGGMTDGINDRISLSGSYGRSLSMNHGEKASRSSRDSPDDLSHDGTGVYLMGENGRETNERLPLEDPCEEMLSIHNASIGLNRSSYEGRSSRSHLNAMETPHNYPTRDDRMLSEENPMYSGMTDGINRVSLNGHHIRSLSWNSSENDKRNNHESLDHRYVGNSFYVMDRNRGEVDEKLPLEGRHEEMLSIHNASIEPMNRLPCEGQSSRSMSIVTEPGDEVNGRHFEPAIMPFSPLELGNIPGDFKANIADGMSKRYTFDGKEFFHAQISSVVSPHTNYGFMNLEGHYADGYRPYAAEDGGGYLRDDDLRSRIRLYGPQDPVFPETTYTGHDAGYGHVLPGYRHLGSSSEPLHLRNMSAIQRYVPQLDELNHTRVGLSHMREPLPPPLPSSILDDPRGLHYGYQSDRRGFASGPYRPYSRNNASGWGND